MSEWMFERDAIRAFRFVRCDFDAQTGVAQLVYAFDDGPELVETVTVPGAPFVLDEARAAALDILDITKMHENVPPQEQAQQAC